MNFKKIFAGVAAGSMVAAMSLTAFATPVYYTDDSLDVAEDCSNMTLATLIAETTATEDISSITYNVTAASDITYNPWAFLHIVVTVDGVTTDYTIAGTDDSYSLYGEAYTDQVLTLDSTIASGSTYKVEAYTQSWDSAADYVFDVEVTSPSASTDDSATASGDFAPVAYLAAAVALAGVALVASKKARA